MIMVTFGIVRKKEANLVAGMSAGDKIAQYELYKYCADYYHAKYRGLFTAPEDAVEEILQNTFIKFWENIESGRIYAEEGLVYGKDGRPLNGSIRTYFMGIARLKYFEWIHDHPLCPSLETESGHSTIYGDYDVNAGYEGLCGDDENAKSEIVANLMSRMSTRCTEILSKFYYEGKDLDRIMLEMPSIESKNALKTKKHKCMDSLRKVATEAYQQYLHSNR